MKVLLTFNDTVHGNQKTHCFENRVLFSFCSRSKVFLLQGLFSQEVMKQELGQRHKALGELH